MFVRVVMPNGYEVSLSEEYALAVGLTILDKPATDRRGNVLPACPSNMPPTPLPTGDDTDVWAMSGPPPQTPPPGVGVGDVWIDVLTGDMFQLTEQQAASRDAATSREA